MKYIAFLRAINVGKRIVKMEHLKNIFESLGFDNVQTFIASGNVVFESASQKITSLEKKIASRLEKELGYEVDTFARTMPALIDLEKQCPFNVSKKDDYVYISFLHEPLNKEANSTLISLQNKFNQFAYTKNEIYWLRLNKDDSIFLKSSLEKILSISTTNRNISTVRNIIQKFQ